MPTSQPPPAADASSSFLEESNCDRSGHAALAVLAVRLEEQAEAHDEQGDLAAAVATRGELAALRRRLLEQVGETPDTLLELSMALDALAVVLKKVGGLPEALDAFVEATACDRRALSLFGPSPPRVRNLALGLEQLAEAALDGGEPARARASIAEAITWREQLDVEGEDLDQALEELALSLLLLGRVCERLPDLPSALAAHERRAQVWRARLARQGGEPGAERGLVSSLWDGCEVALSLGLVNRARRLVDEALGLARPRLVADGDTPATLRYLAVSLRAAADVLRAERDLDGAATALGEAVSLRRRRLSLDAPPDPRVGLADTLTHLAEVQIEQGALLAARASLEESLSLRRAALLQSPSRAEESDLARDEALLASIVPGRIQGAGTATTP